MESQAAPVPQPASVADAARRRIGESAAAAGRLRDGVRARLLNVLTALQPVRESASHQLARIAIAELRDLVAGSHPAVLTEGGLAVAVVGTVADRLPRAVEAHACATRATGRRGETPACARVPAG